MLAPWRRVVRHRVVVNMHSGRAFAGILWARRGPLLVLRHVAMHAPGSEAPVALDGEVLVERSEVEFIQMHG